MQPDSTTRIWFTLDFELGWGMVENGGWRGREARGVYRDLHDRIADVIAVFSRNDVPVTWATVGAMIVDPSKRDFSHLPEQAQTFTHRFVQDAEPTTVDGRDLFDRVVGSDDCHRIACHSFSHLRFNYPGYRHESLVRDLALVRQAVDCEKADSRILVLPQNIESNVNAIAASGVEMYRVSPLDRAGNRYVRKLKNTLGVFPSAENWRNSHGLLSHSGTQFFNSPPGAVHAKYLLWLLKRATLVRSRVERTCISGAPIPTLP